MEGGCVGLSGSVSSIIYANEETGYTVLRLDTGAEGLVTVEIGRAHV